MMEHDLWIPSPVPKDRIRPPSEYEEDKFIVGYSVATINIEYVIQK